MSNCNDNISKVLMRNGTNQQARFVEKLNPSSFQLNDLEVEDWILFTYNFAKHISFFDEESLTKEGDWQNFFNLININEKDIPYRNTRDYERYKEQIKSSLYEFKTEANLTPHLTLFVCFLKLLDFSKQRFNTLTQRHLDFYYKEVLKVDKKEATPDSVHLIFELAKKSQQQLVKEGTLFDGGKDKNGKPIYYESIEEFVPNKTIVSGLKSIFNNDTQREISIKPIANTLDGLEEPLPENNPYWWPFGHSYDVKTGLPRLTPYKAGFAISSPLLKLKEGIRTIFITVTFKALSDKESHLELILENLENWQNKVQILLSGESTWIKAKLKISTSETSYGSEFQDVNTIKFVVEIPKDEDAIENYNQEVLLEKYNTLNPIAKFLINTNNNEGTVGYDLYNILQQRELESIEVKVDVKEVKNIHIENDNGVLRVQKPFFPFTAQPIVGSNFYINYPEVFAKKWQSIDISFKWKNTPKSFRQWYEAYFNSEIARSSVSTYISAVKIEETVAQQASQALQDFADKRAENTAHNTPEQVDNLSANEKTLSEAEKEASRVVKNNTDFNTLLAINHKEEWAKLDKTGKVNLNQKELFSGSNGNFNFNLNIKGSVFEDRIDKTGPIRMTLNSPFFHEIYPRLYAITLSNQDKNLLIPNEPYTPLAEEISLDYIAAETKIFNATVSEVSEEKFNNERIRLFHQHPFGHSEYHEYLEQERKKKAIISDFEDKTTQKLVAQYTKGGELFIGLENTENLQTVSLLIKVLEGSEDTEANFFAEGEKIEWEILCNNYWKKLETDLLKNNTDNLLKSGILQFIIPREATKNNTLLPEGVFWLRAKMDKDYNSVCKLIGIHAQAVLAKFKDRDNELSHLDESLVSGTIKKLIFRIPEIKSISQPYNSFSGKSEESDTTFYRRISERLRHKNRAITQWDYEHMVLQQFPEIFKVKCLNHTEYDVQKNEVKFNAPGNVTLVLIPDIINNNVFDIYEPRVSRALLNKVQSFINKSNSPQLKATVVNPKYEAIKVKLEVQFYESYDPLFYKAQLKKDIEAFLSPWAFSRDKKILFGQELHRSILINYLEELEYVDYLQNVEILKQKQNPNPNEDKFEPIKKSFVSPTDPISILVSHKAHEVEIATKICKTQNTSPEINV